MSDALLNFVPEPDTIPDVGARSRSVCVAVVRCCVAGSRSQSLPPSFSTLLVLAPTLDESRSSHLGVISFLSCAAVYISASDQANQPLSTTNYVTISGLDFRTTDETPSAWWRNGGACETTAWTSNTLVLCKMAPTTQDPEEPLLWLETNLAAGGTGKSSVPFTFDGKGLAPCFPPFRSLIKRLCAARRTLQLMMGERTRRFRGRASYKLFWHA